MWWRPVAVTAAALVVCYAGFLALLLVARPADVTARELVRLLPDTVRLIRRLAADRTLGRAVRWQLAVLVAYLACPVDLVPDFLPVIGYADDAVLVGLVLRSVIRRAGPEAVAAHWPGTRGGYQTLLRLLQVPADG